MLLCLGEPSVRFWCCCYCCCSFLICQCSSFYFIHFQATLPCHQHSWLLRPVKAFTSSELYPDYFWLPFLFHLPGALRFWVGMFFFFFIYRDHYGFEWATCFYQGFPGSRQLFLEICRASYWSLKHRTSSSVCLIHSNPQCFIHLNLYLYMSTLQKFYLWWKLW